MLRLLLLASAICIAFGQSPTQSSVMTTTVPHSATTSTTVAPPAPTGTPEPPTTPPPIPQPNPAEKNYFVNNTDTKTVCLHLSGGFSIKINYTGTGNKEMYRWVDFESPGTEVNGASVCNITAQYVQLKLQYKPSGSQHPFFLTLTFQGHDNKTWNTTGVEVEFTYEASFFPEYIGPTPANGHISSSTSDDFFEDQSVDLKQSFTCMANRSISGFDPITIHMDVSLFVNGLQVQAFRFANATSGAFEQGAVCAQDKDTGNKVVPIAVGAALAGLVIVVLIAYLIGRLRNRKKSSYEALS